MSHRVRRTASGRPGTPPSSKPAGKSPTLRPSGTKGGAATPIPKKSSKSDRIIKKPKKAARMPWTTASRRTMTRSQTKLFRLLDLPAEVRIRLYHYQALSLSNAVPMDLGFVDLPPSLSLNRQTREEALPVFFSSNRFKITVGSNWCVRNKHFHDDRDYDWVNFGHLRLSRTLTGLARAKEGEGGLNEKVIRFRHVTMDLTCACCHGPRHIGTVELTVEGHTAVVKCEDVLKRMGTVEEMYLKVVGLDAIFLEVEKVVEAIKKRQDFNGFTVDDLVAVAGCFRLKPPKDD